MSDPPERTPPESPEKSPGEAPKVKKTRPESLKECIARKKREMAEEREREEELARQELERLEQRSPVLETIEEGDENKEEDKEKPRQRSPSPQPGPSGLQQKPSLGRMRSTPSPSGTSYLVDPYDNSLNANYVKRGRTALISDPDQIRHRCEYDDNYPEAPTRVIAIVDRMREWGLVDRCYFMNNHLRTDVGRRICRIHKHEHYETLANICNCLKSEALEAEASRYDSIFFNKATYEVAIRAVSATLNLCFCVGRGDEAMNGMAIVRPPGHHATYNNFNGYCYLNNVAIAAAALIEDKVVERILIVDIDVHHGQGTQRAFYHRKDVLYFSIHRYEDGCFWPNLKESNFNYIGKGAGLGYNINVPLNATGLTDSDYLAIVFNILLPVAYEYNPTMIIVSAGYDAAIGCPEGKMNVTPGFYAHLISLLTPIARGKIAVVLEGGYFPPTLADGAALTLKALLGGPCPILDPVRHVHPSVIESISNVKRMLMKYWNCFKICEMMPSQEVNSEYEEHKFQIAYFGNPERPPYETKNCYPKNSRLEHDYFVALSDANQYRGSVGLPVHYVYDPLMLAHAPPEGEPERPERPERLASIMNTIQEFHLTDRLFRQPIAVQEFMSASPHRYDYLASIGWHMNNQSKDVYVNERTRDAITLSVCGMLTLADSIMKNRVRSGLALIRPPGHHAEYDKPMGFCFINNVAVAAKYLHDKHNQSRILIVDFDIHHGNGTQNMFYDKDYVMYISIHKDEYGKFFPPNSPRAYYHDGFGRGKGFNINIPFNKDKMGDTEYIAAFTNIVLPAAYSFAPQVIIVSAGFDAGINDPLGGYTVSPETFGHFIQLLKGLAEGRLIVALEGGYNLTTTSYGMAICAKTLLGDPVFMPKNVYKTFSPEAVQTIRDSVKHLKTYWPIFDTHRRLATTPVLLRKVGRFTDRTYGTELVRNLHPDFVHDNQYVECQMEDLNGYQNN